MATSYTRLGNHSAQAAAEVEPGLLRLPLELRQTIYAIIFGPRRIVDVAQVRLELDDWTQSKIYRPQSEKQLEGNALHHDKGSDSASSDVSSGGDAEEDDYGLNVDSMYEWRTGILEVSKAVSNEALDVLYRHHVFVANIHGEGHLRFTKFSVANLRRIRLLRIVARPMGISYVPGSLVMDDQLWRPLLERLVQFCIVAQQPLEASRDYGAPAFEEEMHKWTTWLEPILQFFSTNLSERTVIGLDADERVETTVLMDKHFAGRYQPVKTLTGDFCFERGRFSPESGYCDSDGCDGCNFAGGGFGDDWSD